MSIRKKIKIVTECVTCSLVAAAIVVALLTIIVSLGSV